MPLNLIRTFATPLLLIIIGSRPLLSIPAYSLASTLVETAHAITLFCQPSAKAHRSDSTRSPHHTLAYLRDPYPNCSNKRQAFRDPPRFSSCLKVLCCFTPSQVPGSCCTWYTTANRIGNHVDKGILHWRKVYMATRPAPMLNETIAAIIALCMPPLCQVEIPIFMRQYAKTDPRQGNSIPSCPYPFLQAYVQ